LFLAGVSASPSERSKHIFDYWTPERIKGAIARDFVIDKQQGLGYIRRTDGSFTPHGHNKLIQLSSAKSNPVPMGKPSAGGDSDGPTVSHVEPGDGVTIGASQRFAATVSDSSGVKAVTIVINLPSGS